MKPISDQTQYARAKGGRASGGTRYFAGKFNGEDKIVRLMQQALNERDKDRTGEISLNNLSVDELIIVLEFSCAITERLLREVERRCFQIKK
jgi:hypothetical protein